MTTPANGFVPPRFLAPLIGSSPQVYAEKNTAAAYARLKADHPTARVSGLAAGYWSRATDIDLRLNPAKYSITDVNLSPVGVSPHGLGTRINFHNISESIAAKYGFKAYNSYTFDYTGPKSWDQDAGNIVSKIAHQVIAGDWGNGQDRRERLVKAGYDYDEVQGEVNRLIAGGRLPLDAIAHEVIAGNWGNGNDRKERLTAAGYDYDTVQARVNELV